MILKPLCIYRDIENMFELYSNDEVAKYALWTKHRTYDDTYRLISDCITNSKQYHFAILQDNEFLGHCMIKDYGEDKTATIGYYLLPQYWGKGIGTQIAKELISKTFNKYKFNTVLATCDPNNTNSENVMIKVGMKLKEYKTNDKIKENGDLRDSLIYMINEEDYE